MALALLTMLALLTLGCVGWLCLLALLLGTRPPED